MTVDPISTSPKAMQAYELMCQLEKAIGLVEASAFMFLPNKHLDDKTPIAAIKLGDIVGVKIAIQAIESERRELKQHEAH